MRSLSRWERVGVRGYGPSLVQRSATRFAAQTDLSPLGRGDPMLLVVEQLLNGLQFGLLLFLLAAGLTLVFGIMDFVNLAHGSL